MCKGIAAIDGIVLAVKPFVSIRTDQYTSPCLSCRLINVFEVKSQRGTYRTRRDKLLPFDVTVLSVNGFGDFKFSRTSPANYSLTFKTFQILIADFKSLKVSFGFETLAFASSWNTFWQLRWSVIPSHTRHTVFWFADHGVKEGRSRQNVFNWLTNTKVSNPNKLFNGSISAVGIWSVLTLSRGKRVVRQQLSWEFEIAEAVHWFYGRTRRQWANILFF